MHSDVAIAGVAKAFGVCLVRDLSETKKTITNIRSFTYNLVKKELLNSLFAKSLLIYWQVYFAFLRSSFSSLVVCFLTISMTCFMDLGS